MFTGSGRQEAAFGRSLGLLAVYNTFTFPFQNEHNHMVD